MSHENEGERRCVACGTLSPKTNTSYTLISSAYGWRLTKRIDATGAKVMEWRCPTCWEQLKKQKAL
jgi:hypothetical protein